METMTDGRPPWDRSVWFGLLVLVMFVVLLALGTCFYEPDL